MLNEVELWRRRAAEAFRRACDTHGTDECEMWLDRASYCNDMALRAKAKLKPQRLFWRKQPLKSTSACG